MDKVPLSSMVDPHHVHVAYTLHVLSFEIAWHLSSTWLYWPIHLHHFVTTTPARPHGSQNQENIPKPKPWFGPDWVIGLLFGFVNSDNFVVGSMSRCYSFGGWGQSDPFCYA